MHACICGVSLICFVRRGFIIITIHRSFGGYAVLHITCNHHAVMTITTTTTTLMTLRKKNPSPHFTPINLPLSLSLLLRLHPLFSLYSVSFTSLRKERYLYYAEPSISSLTLSSDPLHVHLHTRLFTYTYTILPTNKQKQTPPAAIFSVLRHQSSQ